MLWTGTFLGLRPIRILKIRPLGPLGAAGVGVTYAWKARKYIRMFMFITWESGIKLQ